jgi:mannose-6-phosphate isomerase-like protein (cupin superfamily)
MWIPMSENLARLRELTDSLHVIPLRSIATFVGNKVDYQCVKGECHGFALLNDGSIAVQYAEATAGTVMKPHMHIDNKEFLLVISGHLQSEVDGVVTEARNGEMIVVEPGTTHTPSAVEDTRMIGITIPASPGYPRL